MYITFYRSHRCPHPYWGWTEGPRETILQTGQTWYWYVVVCVRAIVWCVCVFYLLCWVGSLIRICMVFQKGEYSWHGWRFIWETLSHDQIMWNRIYKLCPFLIHICLFSLSMSALTYIRLHPFTSVYILPSQATNLTFPSTTSRLSFLRCLRRSRTICLSRPRRDGMRNWSRWEGVCLVVCELFFVVDFFGVTQFYWWCICLHDCSMWTCR